MASNQTENYQLNLWEPTDRFLRTEFNENSEKLDAALKAEADARAAGLAALQTAVNGKATTAALNALAQTVNGKADAADVAELTQTVDGKATTAALNALTQTVNGKADASTVTALTQTVDGKATTAALNALTQTVNGKADASTVTALTQTVNGKADAATVNTALAKKADASTVTALTQTVNGKADVSAMNNAVAACSHVAIGTYTGNDAESRVINLGFRPKAVLVFPSHAVLSDDRSNGFYLQGGLAVDGGNCAVLGTNSPGVEVVDQGFRVRNIVSGGIIVTNTKSYVYYYIAFH